MKPNLNICATKKALEGKLQPKETNHTHEDTMSKLSQSNRSKKTKNHTVITK